MIVGFTVSFGQFFGGALETLNWEERIVLWLFYCEYFFALLLG